jgi:hypothetical protein
MKDHSKTLSKIQSIAISNGWKVIDHQQNIGMISFHKVFNGDYARINIYYTKMTVATCINHPKKGKTQLFRKNVNLKLLDKIFKNPRQHTGMGYYTK